MELGMFSWPKFVEVFPVYVGAFGAVALLGATFWQVRTARKDAAKRAAFEYFNNEAQSKESTELEAWINRLKLKYINSADLVPIAEKDSSVTVKISLHIRQLDVLSMGILNKGICESLSKHYASSHIVAEWNYFEDYILCLRKIYSNSKIGGSFETLAIKWSKNEILE